MDRIAAREVTLGALGLRGELETPAGARALVVFAHGSGSSRASPRNRFVAGRLHAHGLATLRLDLLTETEAADRRNVFDIALLGDRLAEAIDWLAAGGGAPGARALGLFGASTGAAAAFVAAAARPGRVAAIVSRGGRGDLAAAVLAQVRAPTLLLVGGADDVVLALNRDVLRQLSCEARLEVIPGATHLFEEPGTLEAVAESAAGWFVRHAPDGTPR